MRSGATELYQQHQIKSEELLWYKYSQDLLHLHPFIDWLIILHINRCIFVAGCSKCSSKAKVKAAQNNGGAGFWCFFSCMLLHRVSLWLKNIIYVSVSIGCPSDPNAHGRVQGEGCQKNYVQKIHPSFALFKWQRVAWIEEDSIKDLRTGGALGKTGNLGRAMLRTKNWKLAYTEVRCWACTKSFAPVWKHFPLM